MAGLDDILDAQYEADAQRAYAARNAPKVAAPRTFATAAEAAKFAGETEANVAGDKAVKRARVAQAPDGSWVVERSETPTTTDATNPDAMAFATDRARKLVAAHPDTTDEEIDAILKWGKRKAATNRVGEDVAATAGDRGYANLPAGWKAAALATTGVDAVARSASMGLSDVAVKAVAGDEGAKNLRDVERGIGESNPALAGAIDTVGALAGFSLAPGLGAARAGAGKVAATAAGREALAFGAYEAGTQAVREIAGTAEHGPGDPEHKWSDSPYARIISAGANGAVTGAVLAFAKPRIDKLLDTAAFEAHPHLAGATRAALEGAVLSSAPTFGGDLALHGPAWTQDPAGAATSLLLFAAFGGATGRTLTDTMRRELGKQGVPPEQAEALAPLIRAALREASSADGKPDPTLLAAAEAAKPAPQPSANRAEAAAVLEDAVNKGLVSPDEVQSPERVDAAQQAAHEATKMGANPAQAAEVAKRTLEAMPPEQRADGSIAAPVMPTREALDRGLIEGPAVPLVEKVLAEGGDTVSSGVGKDGRPFVVGVNKAGETIVERGTPPKAEPPAVEDAKPEDVAAELDSPEAARKASPGPSSEAGFADVAGVSGMIGDAARSFSDALNTTPVPEITRRSPRARNTARELVGVEASRDALGTRLRSEVERRGLDPERVGAVVTEDNLRGIEDQARGRATEHLKAAEAGRAELEDIRRDIADEAADHVDKVATAATSEADRAKIKASYVVAETRRRLADTTGAALKEAKTEIDAARERYKDAKAQIEAMRPPRDGANEGEQAAIDDALGRAREAMNDEVRAAREKLQRIRRGAAGEVERAEKALAETNATTKYASKSRVQRAEEQARRIRDRAERSRKYEVDPKTGKRTLVRRSLDEVVREVAGRESAAARETINAAKVKSLIGPDGYFKTRADYEAARDDPKTRAFLDEVVLPLRARFEQNYRDAKGLDPEAPPLPERGRELGVRVNLLHGDAPTAFEQYGGRKAPEDAKVGKNTKAGSPANLRLQKSPFARRATGQAESYNHNIVDLLMNTHVRGHENAAKHRFFRDLVADGNAVFVRPGKDAIPTEIAGEEAVKVPEFEIPALGGRERRDLYVPKSMMQEIRNLTLADKPFNETLLVKAINKVSVAATVADSFANMGNALGAIFARNSLGVHPAAEAAMRGALRADVIPKILRLARTLFTARTPEMLAKFEQIAIEGGGRDYTHTRLPGGSKNPLAWLQSFAGALDRAGRLMSAEAYDRLAASGHIQNPSAADRADYIQKVGNYQRRAMGRGTRFLAESGISRFIVSAKGRLARGVDTLTGSAGIRNAGMKMRVYGLLQSLTGWAGTAGLAFAATYALTGKAPRPNVPYFAIDTGKDNEDGSPQYVDLSRFLGQTDALRVVGVRAYINAKRRGLSNELAMDGAIEEAQRAWSAIVAGPAANAGAIAAFGHPVASIGRKTTEPAFSSEETEFDNRWLAAVDSFAPTWRIPAAAASDVSSAAGGERFYPKATFWEEMRKQFSYFATQSGMSQEKVETLPERIEFARGAEAVSYIKKEMYQYPPGERVAFIERSLERIKDPAVRDFAARKLRFAKGAAAESDEKAPR